MTLSEHREADHPALALCEVPPCERDERRQSGRKQVTFHSCQLTSLPLATAAIFADVSRTSNGVLLTRCSGAREETMPVSSPEQPLGDGPIAAEPESFSALVARVLNQLSLSAWLPGAFFIACLAALAWFRRKGAVTVEGAAAFVQTNWVPFLILAIPALVITTLLTQAFSFEAIQKLEGYWRGRGLASWTRVVFTKFQLRRKRLLQERFEKAYIKGFETARHRILASHDMNGLVFLAVEADVYQRPRPSGLSPGQHDIANVFSWISECDPWQAAKMLRLDKERREFPADARTMPTKLGNVLRSGEDGVEDGNPLAGFVMRNRQIIPSRVLLHHDQFRTRLDMYCMLVFVSLLGGLISILALWHVAPAGRIGVPIALIAVAAASYSAALTSARGYVSVLGEMNLIIKKKDGQSK